MANARMHIRAHQSDKTIQCQAQDDTFDLLGGEEPLTFQDCIPMFSKSVDKKLLLKLTKVKAAAVKTTCSYGASSVYFPEQQLHKVRAILCFY